MISLTAIFSHWGDADDDDQVTSLDVLRINQWLHDQDLIHWDEPPRFNNPINLRAANVTVPANGIVSSFDALRLNQWLHDRDLEAWDEPLRFFAVLGAPAQPMRYVYSNLGRAGFQHQNWFTDAIGLMLELDTALSLDEVASRALALSMLHQLLGSPDVAFGDLFGDVPLDQWFDVAVTWVEESGLACWDTDGTLLHRFAELMGCDLAI
ncbi:MAG: dockerin type I domain-containing protein [Oscillospiraceae bacterium]|nr:dockerin type I domain-containing protein [Oscillospiraceae bacterium]